MVIVIFSTWNFNIVNKDAYREKKTFSFNILHINQKIVLANLTYLNEIYTKMYPNFVLPDPLCYQLQGV